MPATKRTPTLGTTDSIRQMLAGLDAQAFADRHAEGDDIVRWRVGRRLFFSIASPEYADHVLFTHVDHYAKSQEYELLRAVVGLSLFTDEGESWSRHRQLLNPFMSRRHLNDLCELMVEPIEEFAHGLDASGDGQRFDMAEAMTELTLDVVGRALFGRGLSDVARRLGPVVTTGLRAAERGARIQQLVAPPVWMLRLFVGAVHHAPIPLPGPLAPIQYTMHTIDEIVWEIIRDRQANPTGSADVVSLLLDARDGEGGLTTRRVRDELVTFMLAGHETTANGMAWMWYLLALHPEARDRMLEEVDAVLGDRVPTVDDVRNLPWTTACFQESLRYYSPAWVLPRKVVTDDVIDGHRIPRGATVFIGAHTIHHDARWWPDPERYDPSRFLPENAKGRHRAAYLPFGGGRRVCIGAGFALMEATLMTAMMSRRFTYQLVPGHPVEPETTLTLRPRYGLQMTLRERMPTIAVAA
jgi:cytochrome P450